MSERRPLPHSDGAPPPAASSKESSPEWGRIRTVWETGSETASETASETEAERQIEGDSASGDLGRAARAGAVSADRTGGDAATVVQVPALHLSSDRAHAYWRANLRLSASLLAVWFLASFGLGIVLVEPLNAFRLGGFPLGFWFAQQGSIYVFVALILVYALCMDRIERRLRRR